MGGERIHANLGIHARALMKVICFVRPHQSALAMNGLGLDGSAREYASGLIGVSMGNVVMLPVKQVSRSGSNRQDNWSRSSIVVHQLGNTPEFPLFYV